MMEKFFNLNHTGMFKRLNRLHVAFRGIFVLFLLSNLHFVHAQPGMTPEPKESENIRTTINFNQSISDLTYDFNGTDWYYIAFTKPISGKGTLYIDGEYVGDIQWDKIAYDHTILNLGVTYQSGYQRFFSGSIDEIRVTNSIKEASEIENYYNSGQAFSKEVSTGFIWRFDEGTGDKFYDEDARTAGTLYGTPEWIDGKFGKAIKYDGIDDRGRLNVDLIENQVTYEIWVKFDGEVRSESQTIIQPYGSTSSIDLKIEQTLLEPEPPLREDVLFSIEKLDASAGKQIVIPVLVDKFIDVLTVQHSIKWDPLILEYSGVQDFGLKDLDGASFNLFNPGTLTMAWAPNDVQPVTVTDQTTIYSIVFNVIGSGGESSDVFFSDDPTQREISDSEGNIASAVYEDGKVSVISEIQLEGYIRTQSGEYLPNVEVNLSGGDNQTTHTDEFGQYAFNVEPAKEYTIIPAWTSDMRSDIGVTTLDLVIMEWQILGTKYLMSNYDLIASDVNKSGSLTSLDVAETRGVILHVEEAFKNRGAVDFISYEYTGTPDPFQYNNSITFTPSNSQTGLDFTAVKVGDAGRNWIVNQSGGRYQDLNDFQIMVQSDYESKTEMTVSLKSRDFDNILGLQFTLEWDPEIYKFNQIINKQIQFDTNNQLTNLGKMTLSWNTEDMKGKNLPDSEILSKLNFTKIGNSIDAPIRISSSITPALAFNSNLEALRISAQDEILEIGDLKIYPNPAQDILFINFSCEIISKYAIVTTTGSTVKTGVLENAHQIDIQELGRGVYVLQFIDGQLGRINTKFIKQ